MMAKPLVLGDKAGTHTLLARLLDRNVSRATVLAPSVSF